ncbi:MAG: hypothetical protein AB8B62_16475 [Roseobacter sp.]
MFNSALPSSALSQSSAHDFVRTQWGQFIEQCAAFVENPVAIRDGLTISQNTTEFNKSLDGKQVSYVDAVKALHFEEFKRRIDGHCTVNKYEIPADSSELSNALIELLSATPDISFSGGLFIDARTNQIQQGFYSYIVDDMFPDRDAYVYILIDDYSFSFEVFVDYPIEEGNG